MPVTPSPPLAAVSVLARAMMMCRLALLHAAVEVVRGRRGSVGWVRETGARVRRVARRVAVVDFILIVKR